MLRIGSQIASLASPLWIAVASAALLTGIVCALVLRPRKGAAATGARLLLIAITAALGGSLTWSIFGNVERAALQARADALNAQALAPGSPLACLNSLNGDTVEGACERNLFGSPANVAAAVSYVDEQYVLLSDMTAYAARGGPTIEKMLQPLRQTLEADPFGFLAYVLVMRGCTSENCPGFALLHKPDHVRTNIIAQTLHHYLDQYREAWARSPDASVADLPGVAPAITEAIPPGKHKVDIDFPTAASIPPISIMNPEPKGPANPEAARKEKSSAHDGVDPVWTPAPAQAAK